MSIYEKTYYNNLGEYICISPSTIKSVRFINCKYLPEGLTFGKKNGTISGTFLTDGDFEIQIKYAFTKNGVEKIYLDTISIFVNKNIIRKPPVDFENNDFNPSIEEIDYYLEEIVEKNVDQIGNIESITQEIVELTEPDVSSLDFSTESISNQYHVFQSCDDSNNITLNIPDSIKKSIDDLSSSNFMQYMHVTGANTFVYKI
jgi:hypothetical protein